MFPSFFDDRKHACSRMLVLLFLTALPLAAVERSVPANDLDSRFDLIIEEAAAEYRIDPLLVKAMIWHESRFNPGARGKSGEIGLMQLKPAAAADWAKATGNPPVRAAKLHDPYLNIRIGVWYFARACERWKNSPCAIQFSLAEYNTGRGRLMQCFRKHRGNTAKTLVSAGAAKYAGSISRKYLEYSIAGSNELLAAVEQPAETPRTAAEH